jgi:hypothetical protein
VTAVPLAQRRSFVRRVVGAALLDAHVYEEVEADRGANLQAAGVVALSAAAAGLGGVANHGADGVLWHTAAALLGWYVWAAIAYWIGTRVLPGPHTQADHGELLRTIGFSSAPGVLRVFAFLPGVGVWIFLASTLWMLVAMVIAVRAALDYCTLRRAVVLCAIGFPVYAVTLALSLMLLGPWPI